MTHLIKRVSVDTILPLRQQILRKGFSYEESRFENDSAKTTIHLALYIDQKIEGVATLMRDISSHYNENNQYRLRGMAVSEEKQGQGLGRALFEESLRILETQQVPFLWFNAREHALGFYKQLGCHTAGEIFIIPTAGPHYFMYRELTPSN